MASQHQRVVDLIREVAEIVNANGRFIYGRDIFQSLDYANTATPNSESAKPLISLLPFVLTNENNEDIVFDSAEINMLFLRGADVQDTAEREESIINEMSVLAENFEAVLTSNEIPVYFRIGNIRKQGEYQILMGTDSGVVMTFNLNILQQCTNEIQNGFINQFRNRNQQGQGGQGN